MATLTVQTSSRAGLEPSYASCAGGGDEFANTGKQVIHVKNGDVASKTVTIVTQSTVDDLAVADRDVTIPAGEERIIGPFSTDFYNDSSDLAQLTYDAVTSLTIAVLELGALV